VQTLPDGTPIYPYEHGGTQIWVRDNTDRAVLHQVQTEYPWDELPGDAQCIVDVGAHIGCFLVEAWERYSFASIVAIEPDTTNFRMLIHNTPGWLTPDRAKLIHGYVWYTPGAWALARHNVHSSGHVIVPHTFTSPDYATVALECPQLTLEEIAPHGGIIDILKLDCEGAEMDILANVSSAWLARVRCIVGERHRAMDKWSAIVTRLENEGFTVKDMPSRDNPARGVFLAKRAE
jgi:FkbM family methyltransferase